jgi:hypothetical protein
MIEHILSGPIQKARGVIGRYPDENERYVFPYGEPQMLGVHMLGVSGPLLVRWLLDDELVDEQVLMPWWGSHSAYADTVTEQRPRVA